MIFQCPFCTYALKGVEKEMLGLRVECPSCAQVVDLPTNPYDPGRVIGGDFLIKSRLGEGSIGVVYKAWQISLEREVALKVLSADYTNAKGISAFLYEARAAAELDHINIVKCFAVGDEDGVCYMAMSFVKGETLKDVLDREGKMPVDQALHIIQQVAEALHYAWTEAKLIHRDIKPENIMINEEGIVKLTDLGLALKQKDWNENMDISGSPSYMCPELFAGEKFDTRADIYSLGVTLYQLLSGNLPFRAQTIRSLAKQHFTEEIKWLTKVDSSIPSPVSALVRKMTAKDPKDRYASMDALLRAIWKARQRTAPHRDMVPGIHTISMRRLDYDLQKYGGKQISAETKKSMMESTAAIVMSYRRSPAYLILACAVVVLLILAAIGAAFYVNARNRNSVHPLTRVVDQIYTDLTSANPDLERLDKQCRKLREDLGHPSELVEHNLHLRLSLYLENIRNRRLRTHNTEMENQLRATQLEADKAANEIRRAEEERLEKVYLTKIDRLNARIESLEETLAMEREQRQNLEQKQSRLKEALKTQENTLSEYDREWARNFCSEVYSAILEGYGKKRLTKYFKDRLPENLSESRKEWLRSSVKPFSGLLRAYSALTDNTESLVNTEIEEGKVTMVTSSESAKTTFMVQSGMNPPVEIPWDKLELKSLFTLARKRVLDVPADELKTQLALLTGRLSQAPGMLESNENYALLTEAIVKDAIENIRYLALSDKPQAAKKARSALARFKGVKAFEPYREEIRKLAKDEE